MRNAVKSRESNSQRPLAEQYLKGLQDFLSEGGEDALGCAYELGRSALAEGKSILEITHLHHTALRSLLQESGGFDAAAPVIRGAGAFVAEVISPYEMTHRGFHEAVSALRHLNETLEQEIKRIAHAVHDEAGQLLAAAYLALAELNHDLPASHRDRVDRVKALLDQIDDQFRCLSHELRPTVLDDLGLVAAIQLLAAGVSKRADQAVHVHSLLKQRLPASVETALYRIVQEALKNAAKHSHARNIRIRLGLLGGRVSCLVRDDGTGFDVRSVMAKRAGGGLGLLGIQERLSAMGGTLNIQSFPSQGTTLLIHLPLEGFT
jgi:signal transduction histidine kinase